MPIRFRCSTCDGLLSIARRKAGTAIACPKCQSDNVVPEASTDLANAEADTDQADVEPVDEPLPSGHRGGEAALKLEQPQLIGSANPLQSAGATLAEPEVATESGIYLTPKTVGILALLFFILLALSFATGYLIAG